MFRFTKPRGEQLSFLTECVRCRAEISINNGRVDRHDCHEPARELPYIGELESIKWPGPLAG